MTAKKNVTRDSVTNLFKEFAGQGAVLVIPRPYIKLCQGDHLAALLLSQILYWTDRTDDPEGWFAKSYDEWKSELEMTKYQVKRAITGDKRAKTDEAFPGLKALGVEVSRHRSKFHKGGSTLHYRVNLDVLRDAVLSQFSPVAPDGIVNNVNDQIVNNVDDHIINNVDNDSSETTTETTSKIKNLAPDGAVRIDTPLQPASLQEKGNGETSAKTPEPPVPPAPLPPKRRPIFEAVGYSIFGVRDFRGLGQGGSRIGALEKAARKIAQARFPDASDERIGELVTAFAATEKFKPAIQGVPKFELGFAAYLDKFQPAANSATDYIEPVYILTPEEARNLETEARRIREQGRAQTPGGFPR